MRIGKVTKTAFALAIAVIMMLATAGCGSATVSPLTSQSVPPSEPAVSKSSSAEPAVETSKEPSYDTITIVWYPNESALTFDGARQEFCKLLEQATGKKVVEQLTTDYNIAIEALASGSAQLCFMGAQGYIQAHNKNAAVLPLFVNSGSSGTLSDAIYYSWLSVNTADAGQYMSGSKYSIDNIKGKRISFVSNSSTSGFKVPTAGIIEHFASDSLTTDDLIEGGADMFFSEVLFGGSHQGAAVNLLTGKADIAAFCDTELAPYAKVVSGEENAAGSVYQINDKADAPFDTLAGKQFTIIKSTPVLNGPIAYNSAALTVEDAQKIQTLFCSDEVASNPQMFVVKDSGIAGMFKQGQRFVLVEDSWYDPIRRLS